MITDCTDGISMLVAIKPAGKDHQIYIHGRNSNRVAGRITEIKLAAGNEQVAGVVADLSDLLLVNEMIA